MDLTGQTPYTLTIEYRHKDGLPCLKLERESLIMVRGDTDKNAWGMTELRESPFVFEPL